MSHLHEEVKQLRAAAELLQFQPGFDDVMTQVEWREKWLNDHSQPVFSIHPAEDHGDYHFYLGPTAELEDHLRTLPSGRWRVWPAVLVTEPDGRRTPYPDRWEKTWTVIRP